MEKRNRKCCPFCGSLLAYRRIRIGGYACPSCRKTFNTPSYKSAGVRGRLPASLLPEEVNL